MFSRFLSNKYILATCAIIALSAYTLIASASVTYQPGETLEPGPSCLPDGSCTVVLPSGVAIGDTVTDVTPGSLLFGNTSGHLAQDNSNLFYNGSTHRLGIGTNSPTAKLHIVAAATPGAVGSTTYSGTGLDDANFGGAYTGTQEGCSILLGVASLGTGGSGNDEFIYGYSDNACGDGSNTPLEITPGIPQDLGNGVTVTFASGTGHTQIIMDPLANYWATTLTPPGSAENALLIKNNSGDTLFQVAGNGKVTIGGVEYTFPGSAPASDGYVLSGTTAGVLSWVAQSGGGGGSSLIGATSETGTETWLGDHAGSDASDTNSVIIGNYAGSSMGMGASAGSGSVIVGDHAGNVTYDLGRSVVIGSNAADSLYGMDYGVIIGYDAARNGSATAPYSVIIGANAGYNSSGNIDHSVFIGSGTGTNLNNVMDNTFIGSNAGNDAVNAGGSIFIGLDTGKDSINASNSIFMGYMAGNNADNASNSIFIGFNAGRDDTVNNIGGGHQSILIGDYSHTGGYSDSIALGFYAQNTASNQLMIGSNSIPINEVKVVQSGGTECIIDASGLGCTSDARLKTNIDDLPSDTLDMLLNVRTVTYNWKHDPTGPTNIGFLAQDLEQYFPELVATNEHGQKSVYYAQMTPVLVEAIRELDLKISSISSIADAQNETFLGYMRMWLADVGNGIERITSREIDVKQLCVSNDAGDKTCLTKEQVDQLLGSTPAIQNQTPVPQNPDLVPPQDDPNTDTSEDNVPVDTTADSEGDEVPPVDTGDVTPPNEDPSQETPTPDPLPQV